MLNKIDSPAFLRTLQDEDLVELAEELRQKIIETVAANGGHLAPSLGVVELTLAILAEFNPCKDKLIWDVGHQAYAYKLLTGRRRQFSSLRKFGGLSGFPRMEESPYDHFGVGHSSTSISAALGMAAARDLSGEKHHVLAVIGDGSLTGGEALEGLNLAGHMGKRLIVVLNDNGMSISTNVGALSRFLSRTLSSRWMRQTRREVLEFLRKIPRIGQKLALYAMRGEWSFKSFFTPGMLFEAFRFTYIGPVEGHDIGALRKHLQMAASVEDGPVLLHVRTKKGKGYYPAEKNPTLFHGIGAFDPASGMLLSKKATPSFTDVFADELVQLAENDKRIIAITAAMPEGTGTNLFRDKFPDRFVDTGICEQHAVTFAAGLATRGYKPFLAIYSTFLQRGYDQVVHDVCLQNLPVVFCIDRAGLVGEDGATHHGAFDISYLRHIPNISIMAPRNEAVLRKCLRFAATMETPCAIRYPRGAGFGEIEADDTPIIPGEGELLKDGGELLIIAAGNRAHPALQAMEIIKQSEGLEVAVFDPVWLKPLPVRQLKELAARFSKWLIIEEGSLAGGFSSGVLEFLSDAGLAAGMTVRRLGIGDHFVQHGNQEELRRSEHLDAESIAREALAMLASKNGEVE